jgi:hypothetical protein
MRRPQNCVKRRENTVKMKERHEKNVRTLAALVIVVLGAIGLLYLSGRYFLPLLLPFLIA